MVGKLCRAGEFIIGEWLIGRQAIHGSFSLPAVEVTISGDYTMSNVPNMVAESIGPAADRVGR